MGFQLQSYWRSQKNLNKPIRNLRADPDSGDLLDGRIPDYRKYPVAITLTLKPFFHDKSQRMVVNYVANHLYKYCKKFQIHYVLYPEFTASGVLHWHGYLKVPDHVRQALLVRYCHKYIGLTKCKLIDNVPKWTMYVTKDWELMRKYLMAYALIANSPPPPTLHKQPVKPDEKLIEDSGPPESRESEEVFPQVSATPRVIYEGSLHDFLNGKIKVNSYGQIKYFYGRVRKK